MRNISIILICFLTPFTGLAQKEKLSEVKIICSTTISPANNDPLFVVDGIVFANQEIAKSLNPSIIQSVQVLKGTNATAIYGARGAHGVIVITTKEGFGFITEKEKNKQQASQERSTQTNLESELLIFPNPSKGQTKAQFDLQKAQHITGIIFNTSGQLMATFIDAKVSKGMHTYPINTTNWPSGMYFLQITSDETQSVKPFMVE